LTEAARFIKSHRVWCSFLHWDTHENGHTTVARLKQDIDRHRPAHLIWNSAAVGGRWSSSPGIQRDMMIEGIPAATARDQSRARTDVMREMIHYGLHRHFTAQLGADVRGA